MKTHMVFIKISFQNNASYRLSLNFYNMMSVSIPPFIGQYKQIGLQKR